MRSGVASSVVSDKTDRWEKDRLTITVMLCIENKFKNRETKTRVKTTIWNVNDYI